ncbi:hypothetical protein AUJ10_00740 [Candidatus Pacearchaeota archaeon CG1_02_31_27]|nr:MAG: hypothetical protein AUJ10_00740 [Candidatus Pacearchaeota archaeon CG1_02_31_27]PIN92341.1 MAG: hypothetical protein COU55_00850 [Candidatus Pacearchaeota archaeon CG10_big_fil_rev_8_21_14_0_10_31_59]
MSREVLTELCKLPHRGGGTSNERKAAKIIYKNMKFLGLNPRVEFFPVNKNGFFFYDLIFRIAILVCIILTFINFYAAFFLSFVVLALYARETYVGFTDLNPFFKRKSQNIIGKIENPNARRRVIFLAHYDSAKEMRILTSKFAEFYQKKLEFIPTFVKNPFFIGNMFWYLAILFLFLRLIGFRTIFLDVILAICFLINVFMVYTVVRIMKADYVPGASDNASGVQVVFNLAERFKEENIGNIEFWFVATGFEEGGRKGAMNLVSRHKEEFLDKDTYFVNIDGVGADLLVLLKAEVNENSIYTKYPKSMINLALKTAHRLNMKYVVTKSIAVLTDGHVFIDRWIEGITLVSLDKEWGYKENYHQKTDKFKNLNFGTIKQAEEFAYEFTKDLLKLQYY